MKKVSIVTLGCKVNQYESEELAERLETDGYETTMGLVFADIYVINTCAVTNEAERKSRNIITKLLKLNPNAKIYICGCASEHNTEKFNKGEFIKAIVGNSNKTKLAEQIENDDEEFLNNKKLTSYKRITDRTRAVLWVQNGCNNFCSYCIIPYLRGREQSFPLEEIEPNNVDNFVIKMETGLDEGDIESYQKLINEYNLSEKDAKAITEDGKADRVCGIYEDTYDVGRECLINVHGIPDFLENYIDFEKFGEDEVENTDVWYQLPYGKYAHLS